MNKNYKKPRNISFIYNRKDNEIRHLFFLRKKEEDMLKIFSRLDSPLFSFTKYLGGFETVKDCSCPDGVSNCECGLCSPIEDFTKTGEENYKGKDAFDFFSKESNLFVKKVLVLILLTDFGKDITSIHIIKRESSNMYKVKVRFLDVRNDIEVLNIYHIVDEMTGKEDSRYRLPIMINNSYDDNHFRASIVIDECQPDVAANYEIKKAILNLTRTGFTD